MWVRSVYTLTKIVYKEILSRYKMLYDVALYTQMDGDVGLKKDEKSDSADEGLEVVSPFLLVYEEQQSVHMQKSCEPMNRIQGNTFALKIYVCRCHVHAGGW